MEKPERPKATPAVYLFLIKDGQVLLLLRQNTGFCDGWYSAIAGHVEKYEGVVEALKKEAFEEAGITVNERDFEMKTVVYRKGEKERVDFFFVARTWRGRIENKEPEKCAELKWFDIDNLPENTIGYVKDALHNCLNNIPLMDIEEWEGI